MREPWHAFLFAAVGGIGNGAFWPSQSALITGLFKAAGDAAETDPKIAHHALERKGRMPASLRAIATTRERDELHGALRARCADFPRVHRCACIRPGSRVVARRERGARALPRGPARSRLLGVVGLNLLYVAAGCAPLEVSPVFAKNEAGISERQIGLIFFANTLAIVVAQLPFVKVVDALVGAGLCDRACYCRFRPRLAAACALAAALRRGKCAALSASPAPWRRTS